MNVKTFLGILVTITVAFLGTLFFFRFNTPSIKTQPSEYIAIPQESSSSANMAEKSIPQQNQDKTILPAEKNVNPPVSLPKNPTTTTTAPVPNTFFTLLEGDSVFLAKDDGTFTSNGDVQPSAVTKKFFNYYPDKYDFIIIFTTYPSPTGADYGYVVNNTIKGLGDITFIDKSKIYGSKGILKAVPVLHNIPTNKRFSNLSHELSHYWLMYVQNTPDFQINGDGTHWSNWLDTATREGEYIYYDAEGGFGYKDNGNGTFSVDRINTPPGHSFNKFSSMSLYLMGLLPPSEVRPLTLWETSAANANEADVMVGTKKIVTVDDIIKIAGPRIPAYPNAQRNFKVAYILLAKKGGTATNAQIESIKWIAENFPQEWSFVTGGRSTISPVN